MNLAAASYGRLCVPGTGTQGGTLTAELVDSGVKYAVEWLQTEPRREDRRYAAALLLRELARNAPTLVNAFVTQILELIWVALRDPKLGIRESAADAVSACFAIIAARDSQTRQQFSRIYDETLQGLRSSTIETVHGSLLVLKELLQKSKMFMNDHYHEACEIVYRFRDHREPLIRKQVVTLIPIIANYAPMDFTNHYLLKFMNYLQGLLKSPKERNVAFVAVGKVAGAVGSAIAPYLDGILYYIREGLSVKALVSPSPFVEVIGKVR